MTPGVDVVRGLLDGLWPGRFAPEQLEATAVLGSAGLGLDSIEVAEFALACEEASGRVLDPALLEGTPPTVGRLAAHFWG